MVQFALEVFPAKRKIKYEIIIKMFILLRASFSKLYVI